MKEEIWINADGSGRQETVMDMSAMLPFMMMAMSEDGGFEELLGLEEEDYDESDEYPSDEADEDMEEEEEYAIDEETADEDDNEFLELFESGEPFDTLISFRTLFEEEAAKEGKTAEEAFEEMMANEFTSMEDKMLAGDMFDRFMRASMRLKFDPESEEMFFSFIDNFRHIDAMLFSNFGDLMKAMEKFDPSGSSDEMGMEELDFMNKAQTKYVYEPGKITITREPIAIEDFMDEEDEEMSDEDLEMMMAMMGGADHKLIIHVPGTVTEVSDDEIMYNKRKVLISKSFKEYYFPDAPWSVSIEYEPEAGFVHEKTIVKE